MRKNLDRLKAVRGLHYGVVTKLTKEIDALMATEPLTTEHINHLTVM